MFLSSKTLLSDIMKILTNTPTLLATCFLIVNSAICQTKPVDKCREIKFQSTRNGNIEKLQFKQYNQDGQLISENEILASKFIENYNRETVYSYDKKGNKTKQTVIENGKTKKIVEFKYDKNDILTEEKEINGLNKNNVKEGDSPDVIKVFNGNANSQKLYQNGVSYGEIKSILNAKGAVLRKETTNSKGEITSIETNDYTENGDLLKQEIADNIAKTKMVLLNNYENNLLNIERKSFNNQLVSETQYQYNLKGDLTQKRGLNALMKEDYTLLNEYSANGLLSKSTYFRAGIIVSKMIFEYDTNQNKIKETYFEFENSQPLFTKEWTYDCK